MRTDTRSSKSAIGSRTCLLPRKMKTAFCSLKTVLNLLRHLHLILNALQCLCSLHGRTSTNLNSKTSFEQGIPHTQIPLKLKPSWSQSCLNESAFILTQMSLLLYDSKTIWSRNIHLNLSSSSTGTLILKKLWNATKPHQLSIIDYTMRNTQWIWIKRLSWTRISF